MDGPLVSRYLTLAPNPSIRGVGAPMDGLSALQTSRSPLLLKLAQDAGFSG